MTKQILLLLCFFFFAEFSEAAVWENIPALPQAQKLKQEEALVNNSPAQTSIYTTLATSKEIIEFYKAKLANFGWKLGSEINQQGVNLTVFSKADKILTIMVRNMLEKNFITVTQSIMPQRDSKETQACSECEKRKEELKKKLGVSKDSFNKEINIPEDVIASEGGPKEMSLPKEDTPGRDLQFVPRYPQAVRVNDMEREKGRKVSLAYYTKDSVENVINFYRQNMGNYYWQLENEIDLQNLPQGLSEKIKVAITGKSLVFKSPTASCIISITEDPQNDQGTIIGVNYNEK